MSEAKILVVDDEPNLVDVITFNLRHVGFDVINAFDADEALRKYKSEKPDLILLDVMLPQGSGFDVCRLIRQTDQRIPIIMLTARISESDRVQGFEFGADDYVLKPFATRELVARIRALLRRINAGQDNPVTDMLVSGSLSMTIDAEQRSIRIDGKEVKVSKKEFDLVSMLALHPGRVYDRASLLERVWGVDNLVDERTVDVHIRWLREKIEPTPSQPKHIVTVRGIGYKFQP